MKMTTEEAFVKVLQMHGIEHAFGIIGSAYYVGFVAGCLVTEGASMRLALPHQREKKLSHPVIYFVLCHPVR